MIATPTDDGDMALADEGRRNETRGGGMTRTERRQDQSWAKSSISRAI